MKDNQINDELLEDENKSSKDISLFYIPIVIVFAIIINTIINKNNIMAGLGGTAVPLVIALIGLVSKKPRLYFLTIFIVMFLMSLYGTIRAA